MMSDKLLRTKIGNFGVKPVKINGFGIHAHACSCVLTYSFHHHLGFHDVRDAYHGLKQGILVLNLLKSADLAYLLMIAHVCSLTLFVTI